MIKIQDIKLLKDWQLLTLQEMLDIGIITSHLDGNHGGLYPNKDEFVNEGVPYLSANCIVGEEIDFTKTKFLTKERASSFVKGVAVNDDVLFAHNATVGPVAILKTDLNFVILSTTLTYYRCNKEQILPNYLRLYMNSDFFINQYSEVMKQATRNQVPITKQRTFFHLVPPIEVQQQIVAVVDGAFAAIDQAKENVQRNLQNAKELFQSELNSVFSNNRNGWEEKTLKEVALTFGRGKSKHRPRNAEILYGGNYPFIQTGDVRNAEKFITEHSQTYNDVGLAQSKLWPKGTICITIAANIAETGILDFDSCFPDSMIGLVVDPKKADVNFAYYALQFLKTTLQLLGKGSAQQNINLATFEGQTFPFPSLKEQKIIVHQLDTLAAETKKLESLYQQKLNSLEELKKGILQKAFSGELTEKELAV